MQWKTSFKVGMQWTTSFCITPVQPATGRSKEIVFPVLGLVKPILGPTMGETSRGFSGGNSDCADSPNLGAVLIWYHQRARSIQLTVA